MYHFIKKKNHPLLYNQNTTPKPEPSLIISQESLPLFFQMLPQFLGDAELVLRNWVGEGVKGTQIMSFLILVLYMLRLQNPGDLNTAPKIFKDGVAPELMMLRTLEILHAGRELGLGLQVFSGRFFLWSQYP